MTTVIKKTNKTKLIGKGTYGCVYRPPLFDKSFEGKVNEKQVSKIQEANEETENEINIGKKIQTIRNYPFFFAPLLNSQPITLSEIDEKELKQCDIVQNNLQKKFVSNTMDYVGKKTLAKVFSESLEKTIHNPASIQKFIMNFIGIHNYLLKSVETLNNNDVIHMDIKSNNIMYHKTNKVFVLIDFGLGINSSDLEFSKYKSNKKKPFGISTQAYSPWNIDIQLLSFVARYIQPLNVEKTGYEAADEAKWEEKVERSHFEEMKKIVKMFLENNDLFENAELFTKKDLTSLEKKYHELINSWESEKKTWKDIWVYLQAEKKSWDSYSVNVMMLRLMESANILDFLKKETKEIPVKKADNLQNQVQDAVKMTFTDTSKDLISVHFFKQYIVWLKESILALPKDRPHAPACRESIRSFFIKVTKTSFRTLEDFIAANIASDANYKKTLSTLEKNDVKTMLEEKKLRKPLAKG